jgi:hypothetical protein
MMSGKDARCGVVPRSMLMACSRLDSVSREKGVHAESLMPIVVAEGVAEYAAAVVVFSAGVDVAVAESPVAVVGSCPAAPRYRSWVGLVCWED